MPLFLKMQEQASKHKLLLADDSVTIQKVVNLTFADEGIEVVSVGDGNAAMDRLEEDSPDIVLADVNMPGLTGYEICARIKERDILKQIPVVLLVGSFEPFDEEEAERVGADGYLTKPFQSISQLVEKVSELLGIEAPAETVPEEMSSIGEENHAFAETGGHAAGFEHGSASHEFEELEAPPTYEEDALADFQDEDEFEMSEAFGDEEADPRIAGFNEGEQQIEEVAADFLKTQPLSESDLKEISVDGENGAESDFAVGETKQRFEEAGYSPKVAEDSVDEGSQLEFPEPEAASALNLDEINLLELPPVDANAAEFEDQDEIAGAERHSESSRYDIPRDEDEFDEGADIVVENVAAGGAEAENPDIKVAGDVSKEMVEAITRRVIETLSEKAIREIAWEVVPDLADLIIKKIAEEKMKD